jgi:hypothetical protein
MAAETTHYCISFSSCFYLPFAFLLSLASSLYQLCLYNLLLLLYHLRLYNPSFFFKSLVPLIDCFSTRSCSPLPQILLFLKLLRFYKLSFFLNSRFVQSIAFPKALVSPQSLASQHFLALPRDLAFPPLS